MLESVQEIFAFFQGQHMWWGLVLLMLSAGIEYIFPPFPGDSITVVGALLIPLAGWPFWAVFAAVMLGSTGGAAIDWYVGFWLSRTDARQTWIHRFIERPNVSSKIDKIKERFTRHGSWYIALNRFLPAFRSLFFVAAGLSQLELKRVLFFAALSAALWNAALLAVGSAVGYNLETLAVLVEQYTVAVLSGLGVLLLGWFFFHKIRSRIADSP